MACFSSLACLHFYHQLLDVDLGSHDDFEIFNDEHFKKVNQELEFKFRLNPRVAAIDLLPIYL